MAGERQTYFQNIDWSLVASERSGADISTENFCSVSSLLAEVCDPFGVAFMPMSTDLKGNVAKIRGFLGQEPDARRTLGGLLRREAELGIATNDPSGSNSVLWLKRSFELLYVLLRLVYDSRSEEEDMYTSGMGRLAYEQTLKQWHSWALQNTLPVVMAAMPYRDTLMMKLAYNQQLPLQSVFDSMIPYLQGLHTLLGDLNSLLCEFGIQQPPLVKLEPPPTST